MTTFTDFVPSNVAPFQFTAELDGEAYTVITTYNLFGQRYYVNIYAPDGARILTKPMIGSPVGYDISLVAGYFTSTLIWRVQNGQFEVSP